jgi:uncharacterized membrane protein YuzA (DUF378 family)
MKSLHKVTFILLIIGGLNWLLMGIWGRDLFNMLGLNGSVAMVVYVLVGLSAIYEIFAHKKLCRNCSMNGGGM